MTRRISDTRGILRTQRMPTAITSSPAPQEQPPSGWKVLGAGLGLVALGVALWYAVPADLVDEIFG